MIYICASIVSSQDIVRFYQIQNMKEGDR